MKNKKIQGIVIFLLVVGLAFRYFHLPGGALLLLLGLVGVGVSAILLLVKSCELRHTIYRVILNVLIVLMSVVLASKYLHYSFGDYLGVVIIPIYFVYVAVYFFKKDWERITSVIVVLYSLLALPVLGLNLGVSVTGIVPEGWYDRLGQTQFVSVYMPKDYQTYEIKAIVESAHELILNKREYDAIELLNTSLDKNPDNPVLLLELASIYASINNLEKAIDLLDTGILVDSTFVGLYNNRGLYYYKKREYELATYDFEKAIEIDSLNYSLYTNIALVYFQEARYEECYNAICNAERLGMKESENNEIARIKEASKQYLN